MATHSKPKPKPWHTPPISEKWATGSKKIIITKFSKQPSVLDITVKSGSMKINNYEDLYGSLAAMGAGAYLV